MHVNIVTMPNKEIALTDNESCFKWQVALYCIVMTQRHKRTKPEVVQGECRKLGLLATNDEGY